jgi:hypothetical protein
VDTQYHFTREKLQAKHIQHAYISIVDMTTNILTKSLPKLKHFNYVNNLGMDFVFHQMIIHIPNPLVMP